MEPERIFLERPADRRIEVPDLLDLPDTLEATIFEVLIEVVAVPFVVGEVAEERPPERVAALFRNHVDADAAGLRLGRVAARGVLDLLDHPVVPVHAGVLARAFHVVEADAVDLLHRVRIAVKRERRLLHARGAANVHVV